MTLPSGPQIVGWLADSRWRVMTDSAVETSIGRAFGSVLSLPSPLGGDRRREWVGASESSMVRRKMGRVLETRRVLMWDVWDAMFGDVFVCG